MGIAGVSGPFRGAYETVSFATPSIGANTGNLGTNKAIMWRYTPTNDIVIPADGFQIFCGAIGTNTRINLEAAGSSVLSNTVNSAASQGVGLTTLQNVTATVGDGVGFGTTIPNVIPSKGTYIVAGTQIQATGSNGATATGVVVGNLKFYNVTHPASVRTNFE